MLDKQLKARRRPRCEAKRFCWRRSVGTVVAIPEDEHGEPIVRVGMYVCEKHKAGSMAAAKEYAEDYEKMHKRKKQAPVGEDIMQFEELPSAKYLDGLAKATHTKKTPKVTVSPNAKKVKVNGKTIKTAKKGAKNVSKPKATKPVRTRRAATKPKRAKK